MFFSHFFRHVLARAGSSKGAALWAYNNASTKTRLSALFLGSQQITRRTGGGLSGRLGFGLTPDVPSRTDLPTSPAHPLRAANAQNRSAPPCLATLLVARHTWRIGPVRTPCAPLVHMDK